MLPEDESGQTPINGLYGNSLPYSRKPFISSVLALVIAFFVLFVIYLWYRHAFTIIPNFLAGSTGALTPLILGILSPVLALLIPGKTNKYAAYNEKDLLNKFYWFFIGMTIVSIVVAFILTVILALLFIPFQHLFLQNGNTIAYLLPVHWGVSMIPGFFISLLLSQALLNLLIYPLGIRKAGSKEAYQAAMYYYSIKQFKGANIDQDKLNLILYGFILPCLFVFMFQIT